MYWNHVYVSACPYLDEGDLFTVKYANGSGTPVDIPDVETIATYTCKEGYTTLDTTTRYCNVTWNGTVPTCIKVECNSSLAVLNGFYIPNQPRYVFGDVVWFGCDAGYDLEGNVTLQCQSTGIWNSSSPNCMPVDCNIVDTPEHAFVQYANGTTFLSQAHLQCEQGFNMSGLSVLTCNKSGAWEPDLPHCNVISKHRNTFVFYLYMLIIETKLNYLLFKISIDKRANLTNVNNNLVPLWSFFMFIFSFQQSL